MAETRVAKNIPKVGSAGSVVDVIKLFLAEIWKFEISPLDKIARIGHFKSNYQFYNLYLLKNSIVFTFLCRSYIVTNFFKFLNFGEI